MSSDRPSFYYLGCLDDAVHRYISPGHACDYASLQDELFNLTITADRPLVLNDGYLMHSDGTLQAFYQEDSLLPRLLESGGLKIARRSPLPWIEWINQEANHRNDSYFRRLAKITNDNRRHFENLGQVIDSQSVSSWGYWDTDVSFREVAKHARGRATQLTAEHANTCGEYPAHWTDLVAVIDEFEAFCSQKVTTEGKTGPSRTLFERIVVEWVISEGKPNKTKYDSILPEPAELRKRLAPTRWTRIAGLMMHGNEIYHIAHAISQSTPKDPDAQTRQIDVGPITRVSPLFLDLFQTTLANPVDWADLSERGKNVPLPALPIDIMRNSPSTISQLASPQTNLFKAKGDYLKKREEYLRSGSDLDLANVRDAAGEFTEQLLKRHPRYKSFRTKAPEYFGTAVGIMAGLAVAALTPTSAVLSRVAGAVVGECIKGALSLELEAHERSQTRQVFQTAHRAEGSSFRMQPKFGPLKLNWDAVAPIAKQFIPYQT